MSSNQRQPDQSPPGSVAEEASADESPRQTEEVAEPPTKSFKDLGVVASLCEACKSLNYKLPSPIQAAAIPVALEGRDVIGVAETGSGKTAAFAIPIIQSLLSTPQKLFCLVLAPTRELAVQTGQVFEALGAVVSLRVSVVVGGLDFVAQQIALAKKPHVIVATPGRLLDHLQRTKGFRLHTLKYLVMDEADRLLDMDFGPVLEKILVFLPRERRTYLFSATMSKKVEMLQRAALRDPVRVNAGTGKYQTVATLQERLVFYPAMRKDTYFTYLINEFVGKPTIVFTDTVHEAHRVAILLRNLGFDALVLHGRLSQSVRLGALQRFREGRRQILVATDVAARGLDIAKVDLVINYNMPGTSTTYIHRVGRTARAGKAGYAFTFVNQNEIERFLRLEHAMGKKIESYEMVKEEVMIFDARVEEAKHEARNEMRDFNKAKAKKTKDKRRQGSLGRVGRSRPDDMDAGDEG